MHKISVLVPTYNNEAIIRDCLESVKWADEIVIVDSLSTDSTVEICRVYTDRIILQEFLGYACQKNAALAKCSNDWVLQLDSDEIVEAGLAQEIRDVMTDNEIQPSAYRIPRKNHVLGKWVRTAGLYPDFQIRLFNKTAGQFDGRQIHERLEISGPVATLQHNILHYGMPRISKQISNLDRYTTCEAQEWQKQGRIMRWHHIVVRPIAVFMDRYFRQWGFRDGYRGLILAAYFSFYCFLAYAKLWELKLEAEKVRSVNNHARK